MSLLFWSILWSKKVVTFGPHLGFSYDMRLVNCSIIEAWSPTSHIYWVQGELAMDFGWLNMNRRGGWRFSVPSFGMDGLFFSFHFGYILPDRFWRNHINSLWLFIFVKHASLVENTLLFILKFICPFLCYLFVMQFCSRFVSVSVQL